MPEAKDQLIKVFTFLREFNNLRNPVVRDCSGYRSLLRLDEWPSHPCVTVRRGDQTTESVAAEADAADAAMEPLIRVRRATLTACPAPPAIVDGWLEPTWRDARQAPTTVPLRNFQPDKQQTVTERFEDLPARVQAYRNWRSIREVWAEAEKPSLAAREVYDSIHSLWATLQREGDRVELVLADGMLAVPGEGPNHANLVHHPVLLQRLHLEFDPAGPRFELSTGSDAVELHRSLLRLLPDIDDALIGRFSQSLESRAIEPLGGPSTDDYLRDLVQGLFPKNGEFIRDSITGSALAGPRLWREALILLRPRNEGLTGMLDSILEDLRTTASQLPTGLLRIVGVDTNLGAAGGETTAGSPKSDGDILFSKPANAEQYRIAERLRQASAVLVQGPPGTGKTHTIANLLGHLLSQGKTVLVTAHTTKALRVLRNQVDEALQPLCLSVLDSDAESQAQLSFAAQAIAGRLSAADAPALRRTAEDLRRRRQSVIAEVAELRRRIRDARAAEVHEIVHAGQAWRPIDAAKHVHANAATDGWIPGSIPGNVGCPLADNEARQLYAGHAAFTIEEERQLAVPQPESGKLIAPADFDSYCDAHERMQSIASAHREDLWSDAQDSAPTADLIQGILKRLAEASHTLATSEAWKQEILYAGWSGGDLRAVWTDLLSLSNDLAAEAGAAQRLIAKFGPQLPANWSGRPCAAILKEILEHLGNGGTLGIWSKIRYREWHGFIETCQVDGRLPATPEEFKALLALSNLQEQRQRFAARWQRCLGTHGGPGLETSTGAPERVAQSFAPEIRRLLDWHPCVLEPLLNELGHAGFNWDAWFSESAAEPGDRGDLERLGRALSGGLPLILEARMALIRQAELRAVFDKQRAYLTRFPRSQAAKMLLRAQSLWDGACYSEAHGQLSRLDQLRDLYNTRLTLLARLEGVAPDWAQAIGDRCSPHDREHLPGEASNAWCWKALHQELEARAAANIEELQRSLTEAERELRTLAAEIIELETWAALRERTSLASQQALMGYVHTVRKIGKGTGDKRRVAALLREARQLLVQARSAVPVWIMPLARVYESFEAQRTKFDVVVIDESSQSDVTALAALYLGREHIVVGDNEQVTPDAIGQTNDAVGRLIATGLQEIPNKHLYDGQTSIYDLAEQAFGGVIALREHFRCVPEIIQFCNHLSYNNAIVPLREPHSTALKPALVPHRVHGSRSESGKANAVEADEIASLVMACIESDQYSQAEVGRKEPTTFGVISLLGDEQALKIEEILRRKLPPDVYARHRVLCGNSAQFQGDERDVVFLSMVDGPRNDGPLSAVNDGAKGMFKKRYNVAVSRARNQLWVVHSLDPNTDLKAGDLRRRLIEHARDPHALMRTLVAAGTSTESVFEQLVLGRLINAGFRVKPQWPVGAYRIDLVVIGSSARLAVECDGEKYHTPDRLAQDIERQSMLERLGWRFVRIRGSLFFRDPDRAMQPLFATLAQLGIEPAPPEMDSVKAPDLSIIENVKRRAEQIRSEWRTESPLPEPIPGRMSSRDEEGAYHGGNPQASVVSQPPPVAGFPLNDTSIAARIKVGDCVRCRFASEPGSELVFTIVTSESDLSLDRINQDTPVAKVLLGMGVGEVRDVNLPGGRNKIEVIAISPGPPVAVQSARAIASGVQKAEYVEAPQARPISESNSRRGHLTLNGRLYAYANAKEAMILVLKKLADADSTVLDRCSRHPEIKGKKRRYIAQTAAEIYPNREDLWEHVEHLPGGWLVATNLNNDIKLKIMRRAALIAGLNPSTDFDFSSLTDRMPTSAARAPDGPCEDFTAFLRDDEDDDT